VTAAAEPSNGIPTHVDPKVERTVATREEVRHVEVLIDKAEKRVRAELQRELDKLEVRLKEHQTEVRVSLGFGADTFAQLRNEVQRAKEVAEGKVSARYAAVGDDVKAAQQELQLADRANAAAIAELANQVAPRATPLRMVGWGAALLFTLGGPVVSYLLASARAPERSEVREQENRIRSLEMRVTEISARLAARGATSP